GMAFFYLSKNPNASAGIQFGSRTVLRLGVALLGARITLAQIIELGPAPILIVIGSIILTILFGRFVATLLKLERGMGLLTAGATAICGASAALAISAVMPKHDKLERDTIFTVIAVTALSTLAMIIYPLIVDAIGFDNTEKGIFIGATIHDVAQVVGAGYMVSDETGDVATFTKLLRVAMLAPVVLIFALVVARWGRGQVGSTRGARAGLPWFLVAFVVIVAINSIGVIPAPVQDGMVVMSRWCLVIAIAGLGMKSSFQEMSVLGWRPIALVVIETLFLAGLVLIALILEAGL
ncbi:MAG: putative sulfate exporter family transporter, partial [Rhodospirillaceae bacterium]|nr:putative sulfate exporter family transporter [Rhodospirillaceae bacterium]